jgi:uncharacterized membrane protein YhaH (DUF805 family)
MKNRITMGKHRQKLFLYLAAIPVMLVCAGFTSPLYPHYTGLDSSIFLTIARGMTEGRVPYRDLFDHKGPVFFWMEALGYLLGGRTGVFFLQCLLFGLDLYFTERICDIFLADIWIPAAAFAACFLTLFDHGNLTEEFCMPLILCAFYFELRFLASGDPRHPPAAGFLYGILLGLMAFMRLNNAAIPCALLFCIAADLAMRGQWINLTANICAGLSGLAAVTVPVCLYFGRLGILYDMLYATFLHNFLYARDNSHYPILPAFFYYLFLFLPGACALLVFGRKWKRERGRLWASLLFTTAATYGMLAYTNIYRHYFVLGVPMFAAAAAAACEGQNLPGRRRGPDDPVLGKENRIKNLFSGPLALVLTVTALYTGAAALSACAPVYKTYLSDMAYEEYAGVQAGFSRIPEEERDSVIGYQILANYYFHADILPCYRYFTLQRWWTSEKVDVNGEFLRYVYEEHPLWVVIPADEEGKGIHSVLSEGYVNVYADDLYSLYRFGGKEEKRT